MVKKAFNKIADGLRAATKSAECEHALVVESEYDGGSIRSEFCPRCETSFVYPREREAHRKQRSALETAERMRHDGDGFIEPKKLATH